MKCDQPQRSLIVNADDFGLTPGINRGVIGAFENGILTSASLMVRAPACREAAAFAMANTRLSVGLHVDLCEWECQDEEWKILYEVVPVADANAVAGEVERQLAAFRDFVGRDPTHLDAHQHVHHSEPLRSILLRLGGELDVPVRAFDPEIRYCGEFYGQSDKGYPYPEGISVEAMLAVLQGLGSGLTELACHPAADLDMDSMYRDERKLEFQTLCDPRVRAAVTEEGIALVGFPARRRGWEPV